MKQSYLIGIKTFAVFLLILGLILLLEIEIKAPITYLSFFVLPASFLTYQIQKLRDKQKVDISVRVVAETAVIAGFTSAFALYFAEGFTVLQGIVTFLVALAIYFFFGCLQRKIQIDWMAVCDKEERAKELERARKRKADKV